MNIQIREMIESDCVVITNAFTAQGWNKPIHQFKRYYQDIISGDRVVLIALAEGEFAGYLTIIWQSPYLPFVEKNIPEITDFNVLIKYRKNGIGSHLMDNAERIISDKYDMIGIGVGLTADYGNAQRMYVKRGYIPDGLGISWHEKQLQYGDVVTVDDDLIMCFTKQL